MVKTSKRVVRWSEFITISCYIWAHWPTRKLLFNLCFCRCGANFQHIKYNAMKRYSSRSFPFSFCWISIIIAVLCCANCLFLIISGYLPPSQLPNERFSGTSFFGLVSEISLLRELLQTWDLCEAIKRRDCFCFFSCQRNSIILPSNCF